jgi:hypothetical protein
MIHLILGIILILIGVIALLTWMLYLGFNDISTLWECFFGALKLIFFIIIIVSPFIVGIYLIVSAGVIS